MLKETIGMLLLTVGGASVILYHLSEAIRGLDSERWPTTNGTVIASEISDFSYETTTYFANIKYEYIVESEKFSSSKIAFFDDFAYSFKTVAEGFLSRYRVGTQVTVYYHPTKPELSVLRPGCSPNLSSLMFFGVGLLFFYMGISWLIG